PRKDGVLGVAQVRTLQGRLKRMGYDVGDVDGMVGDAMRSAVRAYQEHNGMIPDGYPTLALLKRVAAEKKASSAPREARIK
ncbi:MAG TPA: peptidoglycan-binding domain-containing protein, partial [Roseiarcus sp.]|nr:peptidoglycan-binding domain-containing protein [Roseiarcus sp.]